METSLKISTFVHHGIYHSVNFFVTFFTIYHIRRLPLYYIWKRLYWCTLCLTIIITINITITSTIIHIIHIIHIIIIVASF